MWAGLAMLVVGWFAAIYATEDEDGTTRLGLALLVYLLMLAYLAFLFWLLL